MREAGRATPRSSRATRTRRRASGRVRDKVGKNEFAARASLGVEDLETRAFAGEHGQTLEDWVPWAWSAP